MYDITVYIAVVVAILLRVYLMRGNFVLPTFYKLGGVNSFNLGSLTSVIIGLISAFTLMQAQPDLFANWFVAGITAYSAPQIADAIVTKGTIIKADQDSELEPEPESVTDVAYDVSEGIDEDLDEDFDESLDESFDEEDGV